MRTYFEHNRQLVLLLSAENLLKAKYMRKSSRIPEMSSPALATIERLIVRGTRAGQLPRGLDGLRLYVLMVALSQFHLSNGHTLSIIFGRDLYDSTISRTRLWQRSKRRNAVPELLLNEANRNRHCSPIGGGVKLRLHVLGIEAIGVTEHRDDVAAPTLRIDNHALVVRDGFTHYPAEGMAATFGPLKIRDKRMNITAATMSRAFPTRRSCGSGLLTAALTREQPRSSVRQTPQATQKRAPW
jgi:hypothetical protein